MYEIKKILSKDIFNWYPNNYPTKSFIESAMNCVDINGIMSVAGLLAPEFIEIEDHVFLYENVANSIEDSRALKCSYGSDRKTVEQYNNLFHLGEFFIVTQNEASSDDRMLNKFGELLIYFWSRRLKELFPAREFSFKIDYDLYDEKGLCLTFWQE